jgi:hypothetical protein
MKNRESIAHRTLIAGYTFSILSSTFSIFWTSLPTIEELEATLDAVDDAEDDEAAVA